MTRATAAKAILSATVLVALIAAPVARADPAAPTTPVVTTTAGMVQGEVVDGIYTFKGIPYAADTGGANRWAAPKDPEPWSDVRDATTYIDICPQANPALDPNVTETDPGVTLEYTLAKILGDDTGPTGAGNGSKMSEDCLGLNVYAPALDEKLPVMVWIHGGALQSGSALSYPGEVLANAGNVVVVTINYRLGFLGYIAHPELNETNFGLLDQVKALEWVRDNIESFGGDSSNVTIFGESAGGTSVLALMASPLSEGLFQRVISESASVNESPNVTVSEGGKLGVAVGEQLGLPAGPDQLEKMREASFEKLVDVEVEMSTLEYNNMPVILYVDNTSLPSCVFCAFKEGSTHQVDLMIGSNKNETSIFNFVFNSSGPNTTSAYEQDMENQFGEIAKEILSLFPGSPDSDAYATSQLVSTAGIYGAPAFFAANKSSDLGNPTFLYNFAGTVAPFHGNAQNEEYNSLGAFHGSEVKYLWSESAPGTDLGRDMQKYWTTFARTGNPNAESLPEWKAFEGVNPSWQVLSNDKIASEPVPEDMQALYAIINNDIYPDWQTTQLGGYNYFAANTTNA